jgi:hypothetical protein
MKIGFSKAVGVPLILGCALILATTFTLLTAGSNRSSAPASQGNGQLKITNETSSIQLLVVSQEDMGDQVLITLQVINAGSKPLVAYTLMKQDRTMLTTNGATTGWMLDPRATDTVRLMMPKTDRRLTIRAAVFDDSSGEGNSQTVKEILDYRIGVKAQFDRAIPLLRALQNGVQAARLASVRDILNLPDRVEGVNPSVSKSEGARHAKQFILGKLDLSNETSHSLHEPNRSRLDETVKSLEKAMTRLER